MTKTMMDGGVTVLRAVTPEPYRHTYTVVRLPSRRRHEKPRWAVTINGDVPERIFSTRQQAVAFLPFNAEVVR